MSEEIHESNVVIFPATPRKRANPTSVTFVGHAFLFGGRTIRLHHGEEVDYEEVPALIDAFRQKGGVFVGADPLEKWFLPWPCAAVRVRPMYDTTQDVLPTT